jgi:hypothetical protein
MTFATSSGGTFRNNLLFMNRCGYAQKDGFSLAGESHTQAGNLIGVDPRFAKHSSAKHEDYHLAAESPAIGHGYKLLAPGEDFDGNLRGRSGRFDIGAYQFVR